MVGMIGIERNLISKLQADVGRRLVEAVEKVGRAAIEKA